MMKVYVVYTKDLNIEGSLDINSLKVFRYEGGMRYASFQFLALKTDKYYPDYVEFVEVLMIISEKIKLKI